MATLIDPTASVDPRAELGEDVEIGPFCMVGPDVVIGQGTRLVSHVSLTGAVVLGRENTVGRFSAVGCEPQDSSYRGEPTRVEIGDRNAIHENVTISRGTQKEDGVTRLGSDNILMANVHVAHDCLLGDGVRLGLGVLLAGHVRIGSHATLDDGSVALQFVTVGCDSLARPMTKVGRDLPPYMVARGNPGEVCGVHAQGLRRRGLVGPDVAAMRMAHRLLFREKVEACRAEERLLVLELLTPAVRQLLIFLSAQRAGRLGRARGH
ncbi:MAG: acyl-(acyl-carrier-protein)--UDP-N-acetylglucosamine O-acyltransferase [Planctomycetota bacterium]|nr:acyl-(acyl-carrier-protein)--UDP-N-acetylglucosamine O-acyltransferase [Planctomycetota bacterium]